MPKVESYEKKIAWIVSGSLGVIICVTAILLLRDIPLFDEYLLLADYRAYIDCQDQVSAAYLDQKDWTEMSIKNVAYTGKFSSDRTIQEYAKEIWKLKPVPVKVEEYEQEKATLLVKAKPATKKGERKTSAKTKTVSRSLTIR